MFKFKDVIPKALFDFDNAIVDLEALYSYFTETRDLINTKKSIFFNEKNISYQLCTFLDEIYSLNSKEEREKYIEEIYNKEVHGTKVSDIMDISWIDGENTIKYSLKAGYQKEEYDPSSARRKRQSILNQENIFARSILSNIVIVFEQYFSSQYETLVVSQSKKYFEDRKVSVSQLFNDGLPQTLTNLINQEVESNMFDSLKTLDRIKEKSQIDVDRYLPIKNEFEEVYYRRNAYIHTYGKANKTYLEKVDKKYTKNLKDGQKLICDDLYLENAIFTAYKIISSLHFELLKSASAGQDDYNSLSEFGFDALQKERYGVAEYIYGILRREHSFEYICKAIYEVNYINSLKLQSKDVSKLIEKFDVSIATDDFKIAKECLLDNHENVYDMLCKTYPDSFNADMIKEWPLFIRFRDSEYYDRFISEHKNDFEKYIHKQEFDELVEV